MRSTLLTRTHALSAAAAWATVCSLGGCSSSSGSPGAGLDAGITPHVDASGLPSAPTLPKSLEACASTPAPSGGAPTAVWTLKQGQVAIGDGIRAGMDIGNLYTSSASSLADTAQVGANDGSSFFIPAPPLSAANPLLPSSTMTGNYYTWAFAPGGTSDFDAYVAAATADPTMDIAYRLSVQSNVHGPAGDVATPTPGAPASQPGDQVVLQIDALLLVDATIAVRFSEDPACHVRNLIRVLGGDVTKPLGLYDILASSVRPTVELYAKTAPAATVSFHILSTGASPFPTDVTQLSCTLTDLTTCDAAVASLQSAAMQFGSGATSVLSTTAPYLSGPMPSGWIVGVAITEPAP
jgi:hypothetical protein